LGNQNFNNGTRRPQDRSRTTGQNNAAPCSLCGLTNHTARTCFYMQNDSGKRLNIIPTFGVCGKCPSNIRPRLHHPEVICPYRTGGPLANKNRN
jgi:hypothetical protein